MIPDMEKVIKELSHMAEWLHEAVIFDAKGKEQTCLNAIELLKEQEEVVRCKDCKHFSFKEYWVDIGHGAKILATDHCPTCNKWANGGCKTDPDGYCFLAERNNALSEE